MPYCFTSSTSTVTLTSSPTANPPASRTWFHIPDMSDRMLSERLRELEAEGVVTRSVIPETPVRVEYALTEKGRALETAIMAIAEWAEHWVPLPTPETETTKP